MLKINTVLATKQWVSDSYVLTASKTFCKHRHACVCDDRPYTINPASTNRKSTEASKKQTATPLQFVFMKSKHSKFKEPLYIYYRPSDPGLNSKPFKSFALNINLINTNVGQSSALSVPDPSRWAGGAGITLEKAMCLCLLRDQHTHQAPLWLNTLVGWNNQLQNCLQALSGSCELQRAHQR